ncbi:hypothetical protein D5086_012214 [Populus alba]|uniref:Uncharacterized protein n=1 Tax=Populus alba TaxID=43335 RepID=A0ACC4C3C8_POPAL
MASRAAVFVYSAFLMMTMMINLAVQYDPRFDYTPGSFDRVPWKSIFLAIFLLFLGCVLLSLSFFIFTGHMGGEKSQAYGLLALGNHYPSCPAPLANRITLTIKDPMLRALIGSSISCDISLSFCGPVCCAVHTSSYAALGST